MATTDTEEGGDLENPLRKTRGVTTELHKAADQAMVIGTVLEKELPADVQVGEVAQALQHTEELEEQLAESAATLAEVSTELELEIAKRRAVAKQLDVSRAQVQELKAEVSESQKPGA